MSRHTQAQGSLWPVGAIAGGIGFVAFLAMMVLGDYSFFGAFFLGLLIAAIVAAILLMAFYRTPEAPGVAPSARAKAPEPAAKPAAAKPAPAPAPKPAPAPSAATAPAAAGIDRDGDGVVEGKDEGTRPAKLDGPRGGQADDLKKIKGIGPKMEQMLHGMGFYHFDQIAAWTDDEVAWVDENLQGFKGRVSRDKWVDQAKTLAAGGSTEFASRVEGGDVY